MSTRRGFSLLELSVVLAIISLIVVFGLDIGTAAIKGSERTVTQERLRVIAKALDAYAKNLGYFPCPSAANITPTSTSFGVEPRVTMGSVSCSTGRVPAAGSPYVYMGAVPVRTLGLPDIYAADGWGNKIQYAVSGDHVGMSNSLATLDGLITIKTGERSTTNNFSYTIARNATPYNDPGAGAVYVIVSHGPDGKGAYPYNGTSVTIACGSSNNNDVENCDGTDTVYYDNPYNDGSQATTFFDDFVLWRSGTLDRLPTSSGGVGTGCSEGCALWCAICDTKYPQPVDGRYCRRALVSTSPCVAYCEYVPLSAMNCP